jgi:putative hydrolase of the HAD superfamily
LIVLCTNDKIITEYQVKERKYEKNAGKIMKKIRNLIFDVGGVLIGYRWKEMFTDDFGLSDEKAETLGSMLFNDPK